LEDTIMWNLTMGFFLPCWLSCSSWRYQTICDVRREDGTLARCRRYMANWRSLCLSKVCTTILRKMLDARGWSKKQGSTDLKCCKSKRALNLLVFT
jgi:hypothetical protein